MMATGLNAHLNLIGSDEALEKLDALSAKLQECKNLIYELGELNVKLEFANGKLAGVSPSTEPE
jgi:hypothetical protein